MYAISMARLSLRASLADKWIEPQMGVARRVLGRPRRAGIKCPIGTK